MAVVLGSRHLTSVRLTAQPWRTTALWCSLLLAVVAGVVFNAERRRAVVPLHAGTVAVGAGGFPTAVPDQPGVLVPGTRVLRNAPDAARLVANERRWLASGSIPQVAELGESTLVRDALLDLRMLGSEHGVAVAGWAEPWHYVWPRDASLVASALARTGHLADAERIVDFLQRVQPASGLFEARYLPDGSGVPDERGVQLDGLGWSLWAMREVADELSGVERTAFVQRHHRLLDRSTGAILRLAVTTGMPPASPDYWEVAERRPTLATAALLRAGLDSAAALYRDLGATSQAVEATRAAERMAAGIYATFADDGFPRYPGGGAGSVDLGVSFLLPPFAFDAVGRDRALPVWRSAAGPMSREAGGLAPGGSWADDGISWNTATSSYAVTAAFVGDRSEAVRRLRWLDEHRTRQGSLPEKVLYNGDPASVAPLAWASAAVLIAADVLAE